MNYEDLTNYSIHYEHDICNFNVFFKYNENVSLKITVNLQEMYITACDPTTLNFLHVYRAPVNMPLDIVITTNITKHIIEENIDFIKDIINELQCALSLAETKNPENGDLFYNFENIFGLYYDAKVYGNYGQTYNKNLFDLDFKLYNCIIFKKRNFGKLLNYISNDIKSKLVGYKLSISTKLKNFSIVKILKPGYAYINKYNNKNVLYYFGKLILIDITSLETFKGHILITNLEYIDREYLEYEGKNAIISLCKRAHIKNNNYIVFDICNVNHYPQYNDIIDDNSICIIQNNLFIDELYCLGKFMDIKTDITIYNIENNVICRLMKPK